MNNVKVKITHLRNYKVARKDSAGNVVVKTERFPVHEAAKYTSFYSLCPKGGTTLVTVTDENGEWFAKARCHPNDQYNKKTGIRLAMERIRKLQEAAKHGLDIGSLDKQS